MRLAERAPARIVPEHLAQIARELRGRLLEHRERGLGVAPRGGQSPLRRGESRARVERVPGPLALSRLQGELDGFVERAPRRFFVPCRQGDRPSHELRERVVLAEARLADAVRMAPRRTSSVRASAPGIARSREQTLEARLRRVARPALRLPGERRLLVSARDNGVFPALVRAASSASSPRSCARAAGES